MYTAISGVSEKSLNVESGLVKNSMNVLIRSESLGSVPERSNPALIRRAERRKVHKM